MGKFIVIEGPDGTGKTTVINSLKAYFKDKNVKFFREPGGSEVGEKIREILLNKDSELSSNTEALLFAAMRSENYEMLKRDLKKYDLVIADRFLMSSICYQGAGLGLGMKEVEELNDFALNGFRPDRYIVLILDANSGIDRKINQRELDRLELRSLDFHERVEAAYRSMIGKENIITINASQSKKEVFDEVICSINELMGWNNWIKNSFMI